MSVTVRDPLAVQFPPKRDAEHGIVWLKVLNGWIQVGDRVAYAVRDGNTAEMAVGTVTGFKERETYSGAFKVIRVKIHVDERSGYRGAGYDGGCEQHDRIIKLFAPMASEANEDLHRSTCTLPRCQG